MSEGGHSRSAPKQWATTHRNSVASARCVVATVDHRRRCAGAVSGGACVGRLATAAGEARSGATCIYVSAARLAG